MLYAFFIKERTYQVPRIGADPLVERTSEAHGLKKNDDI